MPSAIMLRGIMLSVTIKSVMLNVVLLNVVMLNVVTPFTWLPRVTLKQSYIVQGSQSKYSKRATVAVASVFEKNRIV
jgi:hypothetical protein